MKILKDNLDHFYHEKNFLNNEKDLSYITENTTYIIIERIQGSAGFIFPIK